MNKLQVMGLNDHLVRWISDYLTDRKQFVVTNGASSVSSVPITSGVPQGSVLGPLLFNIYINGVANSTSDGSMVLYADDMLLYRPIAKSEDYHVLQNDINSLSQWITDNNLQFNGGKCKYMLISRKRNQIHPPSPILLNGTPLDRVEVFKYLGIHISSDLSWSHHIQTLCSKTRRMLGLLYRRFYADADSFTLRQYYLSFIRPHLEYGCEVWDPHLVKDINALEGVQRFACKICSKQWHPQVEYPLNYVMLNVRGTPHSLPEIQKAKNESEFASQNYSWAVHLS